jgi:mono/diheme cytochrome c family protein
VKFPGTSGRHLFVSLAVAGTALLFGVALIYSGFYNVSALAQHTQPVYNILDTVLVRSIAMRSRSVEVPDLEQMDSLAGLALYAEHCQQCHGSPGIAPDAFSLGMMPSPTAIASIARKRSAREIFWASKNGVKMSGMPAWRYRMSDQELWQVVAFITRVVPNVTVPEYSALRERAAEKFGSLQATGTFVPDPDASLIEYGRVALQEYNCASCHEIPGVTAAKNHVGPPLDGVSGRSFIAGVLANTDENLVRFIRFPREVDPKTMMPNMGVSEQHAQWMVYYFRSLED